MKFIVHKHVLAEIYPYDWYQYRNIVSFKESPSLDMVLLSPQFTFIHLSFESLFWFWRPSIENSLH